jgi:hypothetical protein
LRRFVELNREELLEYRRPNTTIIDKRQRRLRPIG